MSVNQLHAPIDIIIEKSCSEAEHLLQINLSFTKALTEQEMEQNEFSTTTTTTTTTQSLTNINQDISIVQVNPITNESEANCNKISLSLEDAFNKYYVDSSQNSNGNFDKYLQSALKLISYLPEKIDPEVNYKTILLPPTNHKKTLVIDLDETLIHSDLDFQFRYHDEILKFTTDDNEEVILPITLRPRLREFLDFAYEHFELIIFTASCKNYADAIIDHIEKEKQYFTMRLYRDSCTFVQPGLYVKDLTIFGNRNLKDIAIVDNSIFSFAYHLNNGILVTSYYDDKQDVFLIHLKEYLIGILLNAEDVREVNKESFKFEEYKKEIIKYESLKEGNGKNM